MADIADDEYEEWKHMYYKASISIQEREQKLGEAAEFIEKVGQILYFELVSTTVTLVTRFFCSDSWVCMHTHLHVCTETRARS